MRDTMHRRDDPEGKLVRHPEKTGCPFCLSMCQTEIEENMEWIKANDALPEDREVVFIYTDETNVFGINSRLMREHVATFIRGRTADQVNALKRHSASDEFGNNKLPFYWKGDGPCAWFGQEVTHWLRIVPPKE